MATTLVPTTRTRNGQPADAELVAQYTDTGAGLPVLVVCSGWRKTLGRWASEDVYRLEEVSTPLGRGFVLHRSEQAIAKDGPDADESYAVLVARNGQDHTCTCRGYQAHGHCKHHDAVRALLEAGHIDHPGERPAAADPTGPAPW